MSMTEWHTTIQPALRSLRSSARQLRRCAADLRRRPMWETLAEDELRQAETELMNALVDIRVAMKAYYAAEDMDAGKQLEAAE